MNLLSEGNRRIGSTACAKNTLRPAWRASLLTLFLLSACTTTLEDQGPGGTKLTLYAGEEVVLDASSIFAGAGTYYWEQLSGPAVPISEPSATVLRFIAPDVSEVTFIILSLTSFQGDVSAKTVFTVTVIPQGAPFPDSGPAPSPDAGTGSASDSGTASDPDAELEQPVPAPGQYLAMRPEAAPVINGDLSEFAHAPAIDLSPSSGTTAVHKLLWSDTHLYVGADVIDGDVQTTVSSRDGSVWNDDSIELMFDPSAEGGADLSAGDFKIIVNADGVRRDANGFDASWNPTYQVAAVATADGYRIEIAVPWSAFGLAETPSSVWGFETAQSDQTASGSSSKATWSNSNGGSVNDPDGWGELAFDDFIVPAGTPEPMDPSDPVNPNPYPQPDPAVKGLTHDALLSRRSGFARNVTGAGLDADTSTSKHVWVTNTSDSGSGSLRAALSQPNSWIRFAPELGESFTITLSSGTVTPAANITVDGRGKHATIRATHGGSIFTVSNDNQIYVNLDVVHAGTNQHEQADCFNVNGGSGSPADNIWFHHISASGAKDKRMGISFGARVTIDWSELHGGSGHGVLVGCKACTRPDVSYTTMHHNYMHGLPDRYPRVSDGHHAHAYNNVAAAWQWYAMGAVRGAHLLAENNWFAPTNDATAIKASEGSNAKGYVKAVGNVLNGGTSEENQPGNVFSPPYSYVPDSATTAMRDKVMSEAGWQPAGYWQ